MDASTRTFNIYGKTPAGTAALGEPRGELPAAVRQVLIVIDGRRTVDELVRMFGADAAERAIERLAERGLIELLHRFPPADDAPQLDGPPAEEEAPPVKDTPVAAEPASVAKPAIADTPAAAAAQVLAAVQQAEEEMAAQAASTPPAPAPSPAQPSTEYLPLHPTVQRNTEHPRSTLAPWSSRTTTLRAATRSGPATTVDARTTLYGTTTLHTLSAGTSPQRAKRRRPPSGPAIRVIPGAAIVLALALAGVLTHIVHAPEAEVEALRPPPPEPAPAAPVIAAEPENHAPPPAPPHAAPPPVPRAPLASSAAPSTGPQLKIRSQVALQLPQAARDLGIETGHVVVQLHVDPQGVVDAVNLVEATPPQVYDQAMEQAFRQWTFEPLGIPGRMTIEIDVKPPRIAHLDGGSR